MRILISGASGFIGAHLARRCLADGHEVHALLRPGSDDWRIAPIAGRIAIHRLSPADGQTLRTRLRAIGPDRIFHLASNTARRHDGTIGSAREGLGEIADLLTLLEAAAACPEPPRAFIRAGSIAEYGAAPVPYDEDARERPVTAYGASLVASTQLCGTLARHLPFPLVTARLALVYGADQHRSFLVPSLIEAFLERRPMTVARPADRRDLVHVSDVVDALCRIADIADIADAAINVGSGTSIAVGALADLIAALAGGDPQLARREAPSDPVEHRLDIRRIGAQCGWAPRIELSDGLARTIAARRGTRTAEAA